MRRHRGRRRVTSTKVDESSSTGFSSCLHLHLFVFFQDTRSLDKPAQALDRCLWRLRLQHITRTLNAETRFSAVEICINVTAVFIVAITMWLGPLAIPLPLLLERATASLDHLGNIS